MKQFLTAIWVGVINQCQALFRENHTYHMRMPGLIHDLNRIEPNVQEPLQDIMLVEA